MKHIIAALALLGLSLNNLHGHHCPELRVVSLAAAGCVWVAPMSTFETEPEFPLPDIVVAAAYVRTMNDGEYRRAWVTGVSTNLELHVSTNTLWQVVPAGPWQIDYLGQCNNPVVGILANQWGGIYGGTTTGDDLVIVVEPPVLQLDFIFKFHYSGPYVVLYENTGRSQWTPIQIRPTTNGVAEFRIPSGKPVGLYKGGGL